MTVLRIHKDPNGESVFENESMWVDKQQFLTRNPKNDKDTQYTPRMPKAKSSRKGTMEVTFSLVRGVVERSNGGRERAEGKKEVENSNWYR